MSRTGGPHLTKAHMATRHRSAFAPIQNLTLCETLCVCANAAKTANEIADGFLASVAQDIVEGLSHATRTNAVENLEACLFLSQSSCAVSEVLAPELKVRTINLSQYLQKGGLKK